MAARGKSRFADWRVAVRGGLCAATAAGAYALILAGAFGPGSTLALACLYACAVLVLALNVGHDAAHGALTGYGRLDQLIQFAVFSLLGADAYLWRLRHVRSHHVFPNVNGCDIDIDANFFLRLSPNHPRRAHHRFQHLYAPFAFFFVGLHTVFVQDVHYLFKRRLANMAEIEHPRRTYVAFVVGKAIYLTITFGLPITLLPLPAWQVALGAIFASGLCSCLFVYLLIGTHFCDEADFPEVAADGTVPGNWSRHALATSLDWSPHSWLAQFLTGGANTHAAHHLFPGICHIHYRALNPVIVACARAHGIRYNATTWPRMVASHFRFLRRLAREPNGAATA